MNIEPKTSADMEKETLKDKFVNEITRGVISGKYPVGQRLPPERELAERMKVSRTVVRSGLAELVANGVLRQTGRQGCVVVDYRTDGRLPIVNAILTSGGEMSQQILDGYLGARILIESETARLAAQNRTNDDLYRMFTIIREGYDIAEEDIMARAKQEFQFHKQIAIACGNVFYPVFINSMEETALRLLEEMYCPVMKKREALKLQEQLYEAIMERDKEKSVAIMEKMFYHRSSD